MPDINLFAVLVAAGSSFLLGGLWYSPLLFGPRWNRENGSVPQTRHPAIVFGLSFAFALLAAFAFAILLGPRPSLHVALHHGLLIGLCMVAAAFGINYQFAQRSAVLWMIDGGYHTAQSLLFALVFGLWH